MQTQNTHLASPFCVRGGKEVLLLYAREGGVKRGGGEGEGGVIRDRMRGGGGRARTTKKEVLASDAEVYQRSDYQDVGSSFSSGV